MHFSWIFVLFHILSVVISKLIEYTDFFYFRMKIHVSKKSRVSVQKALPVKVDYQAFLMFQFHINSELVKFGVDPISLIFFRKRPRLWNSKMAVGWQCPKAKTRWKNHLKIHFQWVLINDQQLICEVWALFLAFI